MTHLTSRPTNFTLLNVATLFIAQGMNLYYLIKYNRLPFDKSTDGRALVAYTNKEMDMSFLLSSNLHAAEKERQSKRTNGESHPQKKDGQVLKVMGDAVRFTPLRKPEASMKFDPQQRQRRLWPCRPYSQHANNHRRRSHGSS